MTQIYKTKKWQTETTSYKMYHFTSNTNWGNVIPEEEKKNAKSRRHLNSFHLVLPKEPLQLVHQGTKRGCSQGWNWKGMSWSEGRTWAVISGLLPSWVLDVYFEIKDHPDIFFSFLFVEIQEFWWRSWDWNKNFGF